jgi:hypothetical protein
MTYFNLFNIHKMVSLGKKRVYDKIPNFYIKQRNARNSQKKIVERKAMKEFTNEHQAEVLNYLKSTGMELGLLITFGSYPEAGTKRLIWSH